MLLACMTSVASTSLMQFGFGGGWEGGVPVPDSHLKMRSEMLLQATHTHANEGNMRGKRTLSVFACRENFVKALPKVAHQVSPVNSHSHFDVICRQLMGFNNQDQKLTNVVLGNLESFPFSLPSFFFP